MTRVYIVGVGMGGRGSMTGSALEAIAASDVLFGASRMLDCTRGVIIAPGNPGAPELVEAIAPSKIAARVAALGQGKTACVLCSGDVGFFSLARPVARALAALDPAPEVIMVPGITTVQYMAARIGRSWQGVRLVSAHGRDCDILGEILSNGEVFFLTGGEQTPESIIRMLDSVGLGAAEVAVGERLSYEDERITRGTAARLLGRGFDSLSAVWVSHGELGDPEVRAARGHAGIPDGLFVRGKAPMTKCEVRAIVASKVRPADGEVIYDVGAGTGSVSVELSCLNPRCRVWAIECKEDALALMRENRTRFAAFNMSVVEGRAPQALEGLPAPDAVFIGGSTGELEQIARAVLAANPAVRLVLTAVSMETVAQASEVLGRLCDEGLLGPYAGTQVGVTRTREAGRYHLLAPESPVFVFEACGAGERLAKP